MELERDRFETSVDDRTVVVDDVICDGKHERGVGPGAQHPRRVRGVEQAGDDRKRDLFPRDFDDPEPFRRREPGSLSGVGVDDVERALAFYTETLGLKTVKEMADMGMAMFTTAT